MELKNLSIGEQARIVNYRRNNNDCRTKLLALGLTPGTSIEMLRVAPFGDPIEINARGSLITLRKGESDALIVEKVNE